MPELKLDFWPPEVIELNKELASGLHPKLEKVFEENPGEGFPEKFARIATYCEVVMDGMYEVETLCDVIEKVFLPRLRELRENPNPVIIVH